MSYPKKYHGLPNKTVYTGQKVEAAHIQSICDWLRWYIVYFNPSFCAFFTWGGQESVNDTSGSTIPLYPRNVFDNYYFMIGSFADYVDRADVSFIAPTNQISSRILFTGNLRPCLIYAPSQVTYFRFRLGPGIEGFLDIWQQAYVPPEEL